MKGALELVVLGIIACALVHATMGAVYYGLLLALRGEELWGLGVVSLVGWAGMVLTAYMIRLS